MLDRYILEHYVLCRDARQMLVSCYSLSSFQQGIFPYTYLVYFIVYTQLGIVSCGTCAATSCCFLVGYLLQVLYVDLIRQLESQLASKAKLTSLLMCAVLGMWCVVCAATQLRAGSKNKIKKSSYSMEKYQKLQYNYFCVTDRSADATHLLFSSQLTLWRFFTLVPFEVFSPVQIFLIVQTTAIRH